MPAIGIAVGIAVVVIAICVKMLIGGEPISNKDKPNFKPPFKM